MLPNAFLTSGFRTGSTHVYQTLINLGYQGASVHRAVPGCWNEDYMVDLEALDYLGPLHGLLIFHHMRGVGRNPFLLKAYGLRPVVLYRNVLDCLVSLKDSLDATWEKGRGVNFLFGPAPRPHWTALSDLQRYRWIAYNYVPWYFSFMVSWRVADIQKMFLSYEGFYADQVAGVEQLLGWYGAEVTGDIKSATEHETGFNVGVSGRGQNLPSEIIDYTYNHCDAWGELAPWLRETMLDA